MGCKLFVLWLLWVVHWAQCLSQASFYGSSYIALPFKEAKSSTDIHFKFRTLLPNAFILLVAGTTDYCIIRLENGKIKVNINLGAGESELLSKYNTKLNDFKWHAVSLVRREANISIQIDNLPLVQKKLPGRFFELNIHYGLFVGGRGNFSEIFFGHIENFRGCLADLNYNGLTVLEQARLRQLQSVVQKITWNCASEFDTSVDHPISFVDDDAFMLLTENFRSKNIKIQFDLKSQASQGVLFYSFDQSQKLDFLLVEIWKGNLRCIVKSDTNVIELLHGQIADGLWHKVFIQVTALTVEVIVDGAGKSVKNTHEHLFQLGDIYVGGVEVGKRSRAMAKGCKFCDVSFKGCLKHLSISDIKFGLSDVLVSEGLLSGCVWHYWCLQNPCRVDSICIQKGLDSFICQCSEEFCVKRNFTEGYKVFSRTSIATDLELLSVEPLQVLEGQSTIITTKNLFMTLDFQKFGIRDSGINFHIIEAPLHGSITIDIWPHEKNHFSLSDVERDKVHYIHDGSEDHQDIVVLEVEFSPDLSFILPGYLQGRFKFTLSVNIVPVNDSPQLTSSESIVLRVVQGTRTKIREDLLKVNDPDSSPDEIIFNVLNSNGGYFEYYTKEDVKLSTFSQKDIENGMVYFVHDKKTQNDSYISIQVSDGIETSPVSKIRVSVSPQYWRLANNTGLLVLHETTAIITPYNLSFTSNALEEDNELQFLIIKKPSYGVIELEKNVDGWEPVSAFTNHDLKQHRVRYKHTASKPDFDEFQFRLSADKAALYTFRFTFAKCSLKKMSVQDLALNNTWETTLVSENLAFQTQPLQTLDTSIHYVVVTPPVYGYLFSAVSKYKLRSCDIFSQEDILSGNIKYRFNRQPYVYVNDTFEFIVLSPGCRNLTDVLRIVYYPGPELLSAVEFYSRPIVVDEGSSSVIDLSNLNIKSSKFTQLLFNVTQNSEHGFLQVKTNEVLRNATYYFTLLELKNRHVFYKHDNSESETDAFTFSAISSLEENFQYVDRVRINIKLKNDNSPIRAIDKVFHIVVGGERVVTSEDLKYIDADLNTKPSNIVYNSRESPNGNFYFVDTHSKTIEFTQNDLDQNKILFRHKGPEYGKIRLWVTDGQFHVNGVLEVQASAPFIHVNNKKKLIVQQSSITVVTTEHISYSTNVFADNHHVVYEVILQPVFGKLVSTKNLKPLLNFTQANIDMGDVSYINDAISSNADEIGLRIRCKDAVSVAQLGVWILPSTYWEPFEIKTLNKLSVEESTSAVISKHILEITQLNVPSSEIHYYVVQSPENGYLTVLTNSQQSQHDPVNVYYFTQVMVNENRILYIQSVANQTKDCVVFNVTNGMIWHNTIALKIDIIPEQIYLESNNVTVNEGGLVTITPSNLHIVTDYYKNHVKEYVILQEPKHGCVQIHKRCKKFKGFSHKELLAGIVNYLHDGSENLVDEIEISALADQKRSNPITLYVNVQAVNNQKPRLVNNTGLIMWEGGMETITNTMLAAVDDDRPGDSIKYHVLKSWWGSVTTKTNVSEPLTDFTQELIDQGLIVFQNQNGMEAKFTFNITDGVHTSDEYTFHVKTKPVELCLQTKPLYIFPLQKKYLTPAHLSASASDPTRTITYEVLTPPSLGRLMMESETSGIFKIVNSFTQADLNNTQVFYEHTHQFSDLYANDSFVFNVVATLTRPLLSQVLKIDISVSSGGLDAYVTIPKISVNEGGVVKIPLNLSGVVSFLENHAGLRSPIIHAMSMPPLHGVIFLQDNRNVTTFTQVQLESGLVNYEHDHSDSLGDNLHFSLYLIPGYVALCNVTVPIVIDPINDQPFNLMTPAPNLRVVQGENFTITRDELATEDADTPTNKIKYDIISGPSHGMLILLPDRMPITYFTQADIDNKMLIYIHNSSVLKDSFHFRVWDEKFRPQFTLFNIMVVPIQINVSAGLPVYLQQGSDVVFLSEEQFFIETNANKEKIKYVIKREPKRGVLYVRDKPTMGFSQLDLQHELVMYLQTDMTASNDSFRVLGEIVSGNTSVGCEIDVVIKVQPLMQIRNNFTVITDEYNKLSLDVLDATPLAKLTNSNPRFSILSAPSYLQFRKVIRSSGEKRNILDVVVVSFTHEEIQSGLIYVVVKDVQLPFDGLKEKVEFAVAASIFQPAGGELKIHVKSYLDNEIHVTLAGPNDPAGHEGGLHIASPNMTRDYFLIVSMVAGVIVLGIAVIVFIKCRSLEAEELKKEEECLQPMTLPRPPDRLLASPLKQHLDGFTSPLPTALPQCKITPLSRNNALEPHTCYPYGVDEHSDEWSSCEASDPTCPSKNIMLRRNQYWV